MSCQYGDFFEEWEVELVRNRIRRFRRKWVCLQKEGEDDLLQECLIHWYINRKSYNPLREVSRRGFMIRVVQNRLMDIVREKDADKRRVSCFSRDLPSCEGDFTLPFLQDSRENHISSTDFTGAFDLKLDLNRVVQQLNPRQRQICHALGKLGLSAREVSRLLKISPNTLYREIKRIRDRFEQAGLQDYLG